MKEQMSFEHMYNGMLERLETLERHMISNVHHEIISINKNKYEVLKEMYLRLLKDYFNELKKNMLYDLEISYYGKIVAIKDKEGNLKETFNILEVLNNKGV